MDKYLLIGVGGILGAILRYVVSGIIPVKFGIPTGTLTVNLVGSFILGFLMYTSIFGHLPLETKLLFGTGFCGAFTTFSTFSFETFALIEEGLIIKAFFNIFVNLLGCLVLIYLGRTLALTLYR